MLSTSNKSMNHSTYLMNVCRLCGNKGADGKSRAAKSVKHYADIILRYFGLDITHDLCDLHGQVVCDSCRRSLDKLCSPNDQYDVEGELFVFKPHSDDCHVCSIFKPFGKRGNYNKRPFSVNLKKQPLNEKSTSPELVLLFDVLNKTACDLGYHVFNVSSNESRTLSLVSDTSLPKVTVSLAVGHRGTWKLFAYDHPVLDESVCGTFPSIISPENVKSFLFHLKHDFRLCPGNQDYGDVVKHKLDFGGTHAQAFFDKELKPIMDIEVSDMKKISEASIARSVHCHRLTSSSSVRCSSCEKCRPNLHSIRYRLNKESTSEGSTESSVPVGANKWMSRDQVEKKLSATSKQIKGLRRSLDSLRLRVKTLVEEEGLPVNQNMDDMLTSIATSTNPCNDLPENSPQRLLWEQQVKQVSLKNKKSMRWHPVMIRWCLSLYLKSPGAYKQIAASGFLALPHYSTLSKYLHYTEPGCGFNPDIVRRLVEETDVENLPAFKRCVSLAFDEMKIKSGLAYSRSSGKLVGFTDLGTVNNELSEFNRIVEDGSTKSDLATHVLCFMVRGIFLHLSYPLGYYASVGFTSDQLFPCVWEAVRVLTSVGFIVKCFVCDGASPNRKFFKLHRQPDYVENVVYWAVNRFLRSEKIYFISDAPHLIKTTRNNWENSHANNNTRNLMYNGKSISWQHLVELMERDLCANTDVLGLRRAYKLTHEHLHLNPRLRMKVSLATQVLSKTVANLLDIMNDPRTESTRIFVRNMDQFFDCLNVTTYTQWQAKSKLSLKPYTDADDWRFEWLSKDFLVDFLGHWETQAQEHVELNKDERNRLCLSKQTLEGIRITVKSFVEMARALLGMPGVQYLLSEKFSQDPLEEHFSRQRLRGGCNENPSLTEYGRNEIALNVAGSSMIRTFGSNVQGRYRDAGTVDIEDERALPKKPRRK